MLSSQTKEPPNNSRNAMKPITESLPSSLTSAPPMPGLGDGSVDKALLDLDMKLASWTRAMMKTEAELDQLSHPISAARPEPLTPSVPSGDDQVVNSNVLERLNSEDHASQARAETTTANVPADNSQSVLARGQEAPEVDDGDASDQRPTEQEEKSASSVGDWPAWPDPAKQVAVAAQGTDSGKGAKGQGQKSGNDQWIPQTTDAGREADSNAKRQTDGEKKLVARRVNAAAEDENILQGLDADLIVRVRKLRRMDPYSAIDELVERARQAQPEPNQAPAQEPKGSWWRRK